MSGKRHGGPMKSWLLKDARTYLKRYLGGRVPPDYAKRIAAAAESIGLPALPGPNERAGWLAKMAEMAVRARSAT